MQATIVLWIVLAGSILVACGQGRPGGERPEGRTLTSTRQASAGTGAVPPATGSKAITAGAGAQVEVIAKEYAFAPRGPHAAAGRV